MLMTRSTRTGFKTDPDEKGTESISHSAWIVTSWACFKTDPDEKGTESPESSLLIGQTELFQD